VVACPRNQVGKNPSNLDRLPGFSSGAEIDRDNIESLNLAHRLPDHMNEMLRWEREIAELTSELQGEACAADFVGVDQKAGKGSCLTREIG
jgi:hypothetical protein